MAFLRWTLTAWLGLLCLPGLRAQAAIIGPVLLYPGEPYCYRLSDSLARPLEWFLLSDSLYLMSDPKVAEACIIARGPGPWTLGCRYRTGSDTGRTLTATVQMQPVPAMALRITGASPVQYTDTAVDYSINWSWTREATWEILPPQAGSLEKLDELGHRVRVHWHQYRGPVTLKVEAFQGILRSRAATQIVMKSRWQPPGYLYWRQPLPATKALPDSLSHVTLEKGKGAQPPQTAQLHWQFTCSDSLYWLLPNIGGILGNDSGCWQMRQAGNTVWEVVADTLLRQGLALILKPGRHLLRWAYDTNLVHHLQLPALKPPTMIKLSDTAACAGTLFRLKAEVPAGQPFAWDFGDNTFSGLAEVAKRYQMPNADFLSLHTWNALGCRSNTHQQIVNKGSHLPQPFQLHYDRLLDYPLRFTEAEQQHLAPYDVRNWQRAFQFRWYTGSERLLSTAAKPLAVRHPGYYHAWVTDHLGCQFRLGEQALWINLPMDYLQNVHKRPLSTLQTCALPPQWLAQAILP